MATLGNPQHTIAILQKYGFKFQKKYGQNFLIDPRVLEKIIQAANIAQEDFVLEIGPGIGTMTQYLCEHARSVAAVEIDKNLIPILEETLGPYRNVEIIHQDILKMDLRQLVQEKNHGLPIKVVANLPYYITTPIVMGLFESHMPIESVTIMVQKEVADRMQAMPKTKDYGALSLAVQYYSSPKTMAHVPPNAFIPRPKVGSSVIRLTKRPKPPLPVQDEGLLFAIIRASFQQRRKTLANGLQNASNLPIGKELAIKTLKSLGLNPNIRGEALSLEQFIQLSNAFCRVI